MKRLFTCLLVLTLLSVLPLAAMAKPLPAVRIIGPSSFTYSGLPHCPVLQMIDGSYTLVEGVDYTVEYYLNVDVPGGTWTVYPLGIYTNAPSDQLIINKAPLPTINAIPDQVYTGSAITPAFSLNPALPLHNFNIVYSNNTAVGQAKVTLTSNGSNVEAGSVSANFNIQYLSLPLPPIASLAYTSIPYDGSAKTPAVTITGLVLDRDFTVSYQKNTAVGTAQVTATGKGNYTGVSTASFDITHTHVWGAWKDNNDRKTHSRNCSALPTHSETADCTFKEGLFPSTCTQGGYTQFTCSACGYRYTDRMTKPLGHKAGQWVVNKLPTFTEPGGRTLQCAVDGAAMKREPIPAQALPKALRSTLGVDGTDFLMDGEEDQWGSYRKINVSEAGVHSFRLVDEDGTIFGQVHVLVKHGQVTLSYTVFSPYEVLHAGANLSPELSGLTERSRGELQTAEFPFEQPISIQKALGGRSHQYLYVNMQAERSQP